jgi:chromosome segregation ATPase
MNDSASVASAGSQGNLDAPARSALLENNITVSKQTLQANDATVNNIKSQLSSIDATVGSLDAKRQALISAGATPSDPALQGLNSQINQQNSIRSAAESRMTEINISMNKLREKISGMKSEQEGL